MIRIVRELVYEYGDDVTADVDMGHWQVPPGRHEFGPRKVITCRIVTRETVES